LRRHKISIAFGKEGKNQKVVLVAWAILARKKRMEKRHLAAADKTRGGADGMASVSEEVLKVFPESEYQGERGRARCEQ